MTSPGRFSWVNYTGASVAEKDEEDVSIIKSHAMRLAHRRRRKQQALLQRKTPQADPKAAQSTIHTTKATVLQRSQRTDWGQAAICEFLSDFVYPEQALPVTAFQYFSFLPSLYSMHAPRSCLTEAVSAVALARFANKARSNSPELAVSLTVRARSAYINTLSLVNKSMSIPQSRRRDDLLTALCLLTKYELVIGDEHDDVFLSHERGQAALVGEREPEWLQTEVGVGLFRLVYIRHLLNCLALGECPSMALDEVMSEVVFQERHTRTLMALVRQGASLRHKVKTQQELTDSAGLHEVPRLADDVAELEASMAFLARNVPAEMVYESMPNGLQGQPVEETGYEVQYTPGTINVFRDLQHASFWHVFFNLRLHVLQTSLALREASRSMASKQLHSQHSNTDKLDTHEPLSPRSRLQATVDDICGSVPLLPASSGYGKAWLTAEKGGAVAAHYLIWLLAAAASVPGISTAQKAWISDRLAYIGHGQGIREALSYA